MVWYNINVESPILSIYIRLAIRIELEKSVDEVAGLVVAVRVPVIRRRDVQCCLAARLRLSLCFTL